MKISPLYIGITLIVFCTVIPYSPEAQVVINEFLAKNVTTNPDMCDYDDFTDWIELYNSGSAQVDLSGYYLTGDLKKPTKWAIPSGAVIPAQGYLVFWADGYNDKPGSPAKRPYYPYDIDFTTKRYHTNFKLAKSGEQVGLFKGSTLIDSVTFSAQMPDVSMGRNPSDNNNWYKYDQPTPGAANNTAAKPLTLTTYSPEVSFSVPGGFYSSAQTVTLSAPGGASIYYTKNGSFPTVNSSKFGSAIAVSATIILRARCIDADKIAGPVITNTYLINEKARTLPVVSIVADSSFLWDVTIGIYKNSYKLKEIPASIEFITTDGKKAFQVNAGIGPGSLTSYDCPQIPWQISLEPKYGNEFIDYRLFAKPIIKFIRLRLRNSGDAWATNLMADNIIEALIDGQANTQAQAYRPVIVYINGKYWGIMDLREQFDPEFYVQNFGITDTATLNEIKLSLIPGSVMATEGLELIRGTWTDYKSMLSTIKGGIDASRYATVKSLIDVTSLADHTIMHHYAVNTSWGHNMQMWKVSGTPWRWLNVDFDRAFEYSKVAINLFSNSGGGTSAMIPHDTIFSKLVAYTEFKNLFVQRYAAHLNSTFSATRVGAIIDSINDILSPEMADHVARWKADDGIPSVSAWQTEVRNMEKFVTERPAIATAILASQFSLAGTAQLTVNLSIAGAGDIYIAGVKMCSGTSALNFYKNIPVSVKAVAKPGFAFVRWEGLGSTDSISVTLSGNQTITATFQTSGITRPSATAASGNALRLLAWRHTMDGASALELEYAVPGKTPLSIDLYSTSGKKVASIYKYEVNAGPHRMTVSAGNRPPGTYFLKMKSDFGAKVVKAILN
jgi:hypothetical protein